MHSRISIIQLIYYKSRPKNRIVAKTNKKKSTRCVQVNNFFFSSIILHLKCADIFSILIDFIVCVFACLYRGQKHWIAFSIANKKLNLLFALVQFSLSLSLSLSRSFCYSCNFAIHNSILRWRWQWKYVAMIFNRIYTESCFANILTQLMVCYFQ